MFQDVGIQLLATDATKEFAFTLRDLDKSPKLASVAGQARRRQFVHACKATDGYMEAVHTFAKLLDDGEPSIEDLDNLIASVPTNDDGDVFSIHDAVRTILVTC